MTLHVPPYESVAPGVSWDQSKNRLYIVPEVVAKGLGYDYPMDEDQLSALWCGVCQALRTMRPDAQVRQVFILEPVKGNKLADYEGLPRCPNEEEYIPPK